MISDLCHELFYRKTPIRSEQKTEFSNQSTLAKLAKRNDEGINRNQNKRQHQIWNMDELISEEEKKGVKYHFSIKIDLMS